MCKLVFNADTADSVNNRQRKISEFLLVPGLVSPSVGRPFVLPIYSPDGFSVPISASKFTTMH